ncbi:hypothetical protein D0868_09747 [Hortaea werneckii]|uniref:Uncharacterized protein n=1 Tax=Hortaea werneckii TaxID=91943 RepID=A0A3M6Y8B7_HORWE|nr:hypothetical protein D0868_09747 [Hortaea werneckii]
MNEASSGNGLIVGSGGDMMSYRHIRVIIDISAGSKTANEKQDMMRHTMECCMEYEGKKAQDCEFEIRINEVEEGNVMRMLPGMKEMV